MNYSCKDISSDKEQVDAPYLAEDFVLVDMLFLDVRVKVFKKHVGLAEPGFPLYLVDD